jgi:hypothetical protein
MYHEGDIIIRVRNFYEGVVLGTRGKVIDRRPINNPHASSVLVLDGKHRGKQHTWSDSFVELHNKNEIIWEV